MLNSVLHLIFPRESNNHKAKLIRSSGLVLIIALLLVVQIALRFSPRMGVKVLGYAANISTEELVELTNQMRNEAGLPYVEHNSILSSAAQAKAVDMFNGNYWAHVSPDGTEPWDFFENFDYKYRYAGENLARDFSDANSAVEAWMASPSHRENMLSDRYKEIGIAVVDGEMDGIETTLIVQFFGTAFGDKAPSVAIAQAKSDTQTQSKNTSVESETTVYTVPEPDLVISPFNSTRTISLGIVGFLLMILVLDLIMMRVKKIPRIAGRSFAHLAFLGMIIAIVIIAKAGQIL